MVEFKQANTKNNGSHQAEATNAYEGPIVDGQRHGWGKIQLEGGEIYEGYFENNFPKGQGSLQFPDGGDYYEGEVSYNFRVFQIAGKVLRKDGSLAKGRWVRYLDFWAYRAIYDFLTDIYYFA